MRAMCWVLLVSSAAPALSCSTKDPLYCSPDHACTAGLPYCDVDGVFPSSQNIKNTCIEQPYRTTVELQGAGLVLSEPAGIACPGDCDELYENGTPITLHAVPSDGNQFGGWTGDCSGTDVSCALTATATHAVVARFAPPSHYTVAVQGMGTVVSDPPGINCPGTCDATFMPYSHIKMTATAADGSAFTSWTGGCTGANPDCQSDALGDKTFTARFARQLTLTITLDGDGTGHVTSTDGLIDCATTCTTTLGEGAVVTLDHAGIGDGGFDGWSGPCSGEDQCVITLASSTTVTATFRAPWTRTIKQGVATAGGGVAVSKAGDIYVSGSATATSRGPFAGIVVKYDRGGTQAWSVGVCGSQTLNCQMKSIAIAADDSAIAVVGLFNFVPGADLNWIVAKYTPAGTQAWAVTYGNPASSSDVPDAVAFDVDGSVVAVGMESLSLGDFHALVRKYTAGGMLSWSNTSTPKSEISGIVIDETSVGRLLGHDVSGSTVSTWLKALSAAGAVGQPQSVNFLATKIALTAGSKILLAGSDTTVARLQLLNSDQSVAWTKDEALATAWLDLCVDPTRSLVYVVGNGTTSTVLDAYDASGTRVLSLQDTGTGASGVACDPVKHDVTVVGTKNGLGWIKHYYR